ncbi:hypothetical protein [Reyranella sp.]|uniref:hypothetical protein n=1 Tax=Reyranella sp. TaxID=1929291 RepID=UPI001222E9ED|nr:hypothetical protein [Reyranella sp.]TAJ82886.1 MAG: hypothetical protein EPO50_24605 [Reyranella sp.]
MISTPVQGARERRGARKEPKRQRSREGSCPPAQSHAAEPPPSGRNAESIEVAEVKRPLAAFNSMRPMKPETIQEALQLQSGAALKRAIGKALIAEDGDYTGGRCELAEADAMDARVSDFLDIGSHITGRISEGNGGELIVRTREASGSIPGVIDTVRESPDMLSASASRARLELTGTRSPWPWTQRRASSRRTAWKRCSLIS